MKSKEKDQELDLFYLKESDKKQTVKKNQKAKRMQEKKKKQKKEFEGELNKTKNKGKNEKQRAKEEEKKKKHREKRIQKKIEKNKKEREKQDKDYIEDVKFELENDIAINLAQKNKESSVKKEKKPKVQNKKPVNKKKEKALKRIKRFFQIIFLISIIIGIVAFAFTSPIFNITEIKVIDNSKVPTETIQSLSQIQIGQNIFNFNNKDVINRVLENSYINEVEVKRILPTTIQISVKERQAAYTIMLLDKYVYIDNQGYILEISSANNELIVLENYTTPEVDLVPNKRLNEEDLEKIDDVNKILNSSKDSGIDEKITGINIQDDSNYILYLAHDSKIIHIGDVSNMSEKIIYAIAMLNEEEGIKGDIFVNGDLNGKFKPYFRENVDI